MKKKIIICLILVLIIVGIIVYFVFFNKNNNKETNNTNTNDTNTPNATVTTVPTSPTPINNIEEMTAQEKSIFNSKFDIYMGSNVSAQKVKILIATINHSNENSSIKKVALSFNGKAETSPQVADSSTYTVTFEYDKNGLISKAIVEENK